MTDANVVPAVRRLPTRKVTWISAIICVTVLIGAAIPVALFLRPKAGVHAEKSIPYLGVYDRSLPLSYHGATEFTTATGIRPNVLMYYSAWNEPFQTAFATSASEHGAVPLVQINPSDVSFPAIASGQYDDYLGAYADAVRSYHRPVIMSFGHEMNGNWYTWAYTHTSPRAFVAAWRHIVSLFRQAGARNVTWLWTVNIINTDGNIPPPDPWWPGGSYVNWVGIDGYYYSPSVTFASLFGPTITDIRQLTGDPILIAETAVTPDAGQAAKVADLFAGVRLYNLLGFVWFEVNEYRISGSGAIGAFRRGAKAYEGGAP